MTQQSAQQTAPQNPRDSFQREVQLPKTAFREQCSFAAIERKAPYTLVPTTKPPLPCLHPRKFHHSLLPRRLGNPHIRPSNPDTSITAFFIKLNTDILNLGMEIGVVGKVLLHFGDECVALTCHPRAVVHIVVAAEIRDEQFTRHFPEGAGVEGVD